MKNTLIPLDMIFVRADGTHRQHRGQHRAAVARAGPSERAGRGGARDCRRPVGRAGHQAPATRSTGAQAVPAQLALAPKRVTRQRRRPWESSQTPSPGGTAPPGARRSSRAATARRSGATRPAMSISSTQGPGAALGDLRRLATTAAGFRRAGMPGCAGRSTTCPKRRCRRGASSSRRRSPTSPARMAAYRPGGSLAAQGHPPGVDRRLSGVEARISVRRVQRPPAHRAARRWPAAATAAEQG